MPPLKLPPIGFGTYKLLGKEAQVMVEAAFNLGYRLFDTATFYENEGEIGRALCKKTRKDYILSTKVWLEDMGYHPALNAFDRSLNQLQVDYIDLYSVHWPWPRGLVLETLEAIETLKAKGRIREYGVSNCTIHHLEDIREGGFKIFSNQVEYHLYLDQRNLLDYCLNHNIKVVGYCPLVRSRLEPVGTLVEIARKHEKTIAQIALKWLIQKEIVPIPKTSRRERLRENFDLFDFTLSDEEIGRLNRLNRNDRIVTPDCGDFEY